jgi:lysozyme
MTSEAREHLRQHLLVDEGLRLKPYVDTVGKVTIGIGRNLDDVGISREEAYYLLENDIDKAYRVLVARLPWVLRLDDVRQVVLTNMAFNMGINSLTKFIHTLGAVQRGDWSTAAKGMRGSLWYRQVQKSRSERLIQMMLTGEWPEDQP